MIHVLGFLLTIAQALDVLSTRAAMLNGGYETNPFMVEFVTAPLWVQLTVKVGFGLLSWAGFATHGKHPAVLAAAGFLVGVYAHTIYTNFLIGG